MAESAVRGADGDVLRARELTNLTPRGPETLSIADTVVGSSVFRVGIRG